MPDSKILKLLLVEDDLEDEQLLSEALIEIEENRQWCNWRTASVLHVEQLEEALDCLRGESFDAILLNLSLPDSPMLLDSFHAVNSCARGAPIIVLADEDDENLANWLLREGAQDVFLKQELECAPLARSLRYAIERQRRIAALRSAPFDDELTGALTRQSFLTIADHYVQLLSRSSGPLMFASMQIEDRSKETQEDREARDMLLLRAAEVLRSTFEPPALIGRASPLSFCVITTGLMTPTVEALLNRAALAVEEVACVEGRISATVRFSVMRIEHGANLEDMLAARGEDFARSTQRRAKTVMLAD